MGSGLSWLFFSLGVPLGRCEQQNAQNEEHDRNSCDLDLVEKAMLTASVTLQRDTHTDGRSRVSERVSERERESGETRRGRHSFLHLLVYTVRHTHTHSGFFAIHCVSCRRCRCWRWLQRTQNTQRTILVAATMGALVPNKRPFMLAESSFVDTFLFRREKKKEAAIDYWMMFAQKQRCHSKLLIHYTVDMGNYKHTNMLTGNERRRRGHIANGRRNE